MDTTADDGTPGSSVPRVKICGITDEADRDAAARAGADALGFIVDVPVDTPREISPERAATLVDGVGPFVSTVLVTMAASVEDIVALHERTDTTAVQVHDGLTPAEITDLRRQARCDVIAAVDIDDPAVEAYAGAADALLVDSTDDSGAGGTGETHDWERTQELVASVDAPVILAGGLTPANVADAVDTVDPFGVDTASGVERRGGQKDHDAVTAFVRRAGRQEVRP